MRGLEGWCGIFVCFLVWFSVYGLDPEVKKSKLEILRFKLAEVGIELDHFAPGQYNALTCPMVKIFACYFLLQC
jgi:twinkle protein